MLVNVDFIKLKDVEHFDATQPNTMTAIQGSQVGSAHPFRSNAFC